MAIDLDGPNSAINVNSVETYSGSTLTIGKSGDTVSLGSGASASGFSKDGAITWDSSIKSANTSITTGTGFFVDTTSAAITITLPASPSVGDIVGIKDYAGTFGTNNLTIARNGSNIQGGANDSLITTDRASVVLVYADATKGWLYTVESNVGDLEKLLMAATGGTITTDGDYKVHTFTSSGTFTVTKTSPTSNSVDYLVVGGGGGGGSDRGGGGGAGGHRYSFPNPATGGQPVTTTSYPITVGGGGGGGAQAPTGGAGSQGTNGSSSSAFPITSAGGGGGGGCATGGIREGLPGGSGGGGSQFLGAGSGGTGNTPSVSPPQGQNGGTGFEAGGAGGGGGATGTGGNASPGVGGTGGAGTSLTIPGTSTTTAGGGGGGGSSTAGSGGSGGGGAGGQNPGPPSFAATAGTVNTGGGGGGGGQAVANSAGASGGSGVVVIRYKFQ